LDERVIKQILNENKGHHISIKKIKEEYKRKTNFGDFSLQTLWKFLKKRMNYRFRKVSLVSSKRKQNRFNVMNHLFSKKYIDHISRNKKFIYIDECSFLGFNHKLRTWHDGKANETIEHCGRFKSFCLVAAMDEKEMVHYQIQDNSMKANDYLKFLKELLKKLEEKNKLLNPFRKETNVLYMDNAKTHSNKTVLEYLKDQEIETIFAVPYTPELNAIELFFSDVKQEYYTKNFKKR